jgi:hypothetical protein
MPDNAPTLPDPKTPPQTQQPGNPKPPISTPRGPQKR